MNLLYCGDSNIERGLIISVLSLMEQVKEELNIYVLTMSLETKEKTYVPVRQETIRVLQEKLREHDENSTIQRVDLTGEFCRMQPESNMETRFTPFCMLRLYADLIEELPDRILYLDNDVICRGDLTELYYRDLTGLEMAGVLDYYGRWFFHNHGLRMDYMNSGVLLLNLEEIRKTGLFQRCREYCRNEKMFMPDQSAINKLSKNRALVPRRFNEQRKLKKDTVLQHFTTSFRLWPWLHTVTVKPWNVEKVHSVLKLHEYDHILEQYQKLWNEIGETVS